MDRFDLRRRLFAEWLGTLLLLAVAVGSGIMPIHMPAFIAAQLVGATVATLLFGWLLRARQPATAEADSA